jgi:hypothetical protein
MGETKTKGIAFPWFGTMKIMKIMKTMKTMKIMKTMEKWSDPIAEVFQRGRERVERNRPPSGGNHHRRIRSILGSDRRSQRGFTRGGSPGGIVVEIDSFRP